MSTVSDTFCILPFIHLEARADGFVAPCCMSTHFFTKEDGTKFTLARESMTDVWKSKAVRDLRGALVAGKKHPACSSCWREEAAGKVSKRQRENKRWWNKIEAVLSVPEDDLQPIFLDLKLGNLCNLKCRICSVGSSSKWIKETIDIYGSDVITNAAKNLSTASFPLERKMLMNWHEHNPRFWTDLEEWLPHVEHFEIYGGEPFLIERHFELLRHAVENGWSKNQTVHYNTNGTIFPEDAIQNLFPHFKRVDIMLSIDGIGEQFEYQRYPAKWPAVEQNMKRFLEIMGPQDVHVCLTVSSLNIFYLPEYIRYFHAINMPVWLNMLYNPDHLTAVNLPERVKQKVATKIETLGDEKAILVEPIDGVLSLMNTPGNDKQLTVFLKSLDAHDKYRRESYAETFPEFWSILTAK
jgi:pyruvate-formate lyase-activating enzyme